MPSCTLDSSESQPRFWSKQRLWFANICYTLRFVIVDSRVESVQQGTAWRWLREDKPATLRADHSWRRVRFVGVEGDCSLFGREISPWGPLSIPQRPKTARDHKSTISIWLCHIASATARNLCEYWRAGHHSPSLAAIIIPNHSIQRFTWARRKYPPKSARNCTKLWGGWTAFWRDKIMSPATSLRSPISPPWLRFRPSLYVFTLYCRHFKLFQRRFLLSIECRRGLE